MKRQLSGEEAALWARLAQTVTPIRGRTKLKAESTLAEPAGHPPRRVRVVSPVPAAPQLKGITVPASIRPLDLHGASLEAAHSRLDHGLALAMAQGARVLLLITGRARPVDETTHRGERRGAIRAKVMDWLAAGPHASRIAAVRPAHPRHGGAGALYIVLKRAR